MAQYVGFMSQFKRDNIMVFKVKNYEIKRSTGARCDQAPREGAIRQIVDILQQTGSSGDTILKFKGKKKLELCVVQELMLRYLQMIKKNNKNWFVTPSEAIILKL